ncbi:hypothetical protein BDZ94DRAFT_1244001 [Collybia nuda]|uniref:CSN8/PSMD8/EIF3K domain-containing protein n=1 Tax=Collybia nuda TaxID=64659 RepID=A0A9P5YHR4_9AGAR|nr:hypothetical protein BDZ94DRAFT_1244001 [Collybia nuda]
MANGPLTPPPTTVAELQDEARSADILPEAVTPVTQTPTQDNYQRIFPAISELAIHSQFEDLVHTAENADLNIDGDRHTTRLLITTPLVLAYLILDKFPPARYVLTRLPDNLTSMPLVKSLMGLVASTGERKYTAVYSRAEALFNIVTQPEFFNASLSQLTVGMITAFVESFRQRTFALVSKAYTSLPLLLAQTYLGLPPDQLLVAAEKACWSYDVSTQVLTPGSKGLPIHSTLSPAFSSLSTFNFVADSVARLEL